MKCRSEELRGRHRRVLLWSLGAAAAAHVAVFAFSPTFRADPVFAPDGVIRAEDGGEALPLFVRASFEAPGERFPAPVDLIQPISLLPTR